MRSEGGLDARAFATRLGPGLVAAACFLLAGCDAAPREGSSTPASTLEELSVAIEGEDLVYIRSGLMPLSDAGVAEIADAARRLDLPLRVLDAAELYGWMDEGRRAPATPETPETPKTARDSAAAALIARGATAHFPALLVRREGRPVGHAILGFKTADAYRDIVARRLAGEDEVSGEPPKDISGVALTTRSGDAASPPGGRSGPGGPPGQEGWRDLEVEGDPGAYFRWIPGTRSIAFEMDGAIHLLDLETGERAEGPGYVDLVPSPDGKIFVTPGRGRAGLEFYEVEAVRRAATGGRGADVRPVHADPRMQDQYPSVGLLGTEETGRGTVAVYRVLTAWFDRAVFRDYRVTIPAGGRGALQVRPLGEPVTACRDRRISLPILSPTGDELGARDESTGTTKIFGLDASGGCAEALDLGIPSGKIAFGDDGRRVAFSVPRGAVRSGGGPPWFRMGGGDAAGTHGIHVLDRDGNRMSRVPGSEEVRRLAIPELAGPEGVVFLLAGEGRDEASRFRIVLRY